MKPLIHFENEPFSAYCVGMGDGPVSCTPFVGETNNQCGVGIHFAGKNAFLWGFLMPRDLITAWRATEILRRLKVIDEGTLCHAYYAAQRISHSSDSEKVGAIIKIIGQPTLDEIKSLPVPESIILAILDGQKRELMERPNLYPITFEVLEGNLEWCQDFANAKVPRPEEMLRHFDEVERNRLNFQNNARSKRREYLGSFRSLLDSYAAVVSEVNIDSLEEALHSSLGHIGRSRQPKEVLVAVAGVAAMLLGQDSTMEEIEQACFRSADWQLFRGKSRRLLFFPWKDKEKKLRESVDNLQSLLLLYFQEKVKALKENAA